MYFVFYFYTGLLLALPIVVILVKYHETRQDPLWTSIFMVVVMILLWPLVGPFVIYLWFNHMDAYNPVRRMEWAPDYLGYWLVDRKGNSHAFGSAIHHLFTEGKSHSFQPDELSINPSGRILCADGVGYYGDLFEQELLAPIVGVLPNEEHSGYYVFTQAGEVFAFGNVELYGSLAEVDPTQYGISWKGYKEQQQQEEAAALPAQFDSVVTTAVPTPA